MQAITYRGKILELEGLRGLAILLVTLHHFWPSSGSFYERFFAVGHLGWIGVDLFFVISGLLIGGILLDTREDPGYFRNFYARRVVRIFPLYYLLVLTVYALVPTVQAYLHKVSYLQSEFIAQSGHPLWYLLFSGNIREAIRGVEPAYMLAPLWSISIEEQFYFCAPLLIMSLPRRRLSFLLGAFMLLAPLFRYLMWQSFPDNERIQYLATLSRLDNLSIGLLMAIMLRSEVRWKFKWLWPLLLALTAAFVVMFVSGLFNRFTFFCRVFGYSFLAI
jgi:peptidoglycan/LPS O-acetylase OafA/YrhL